MIVSDEAVRMTRFRKRDLLPVAEELASLHPIGCLGHLVYHEQIWLHCENRRLDLARLSINGSLEAHGHLQRLVLGIRIWHGRKQLHGLWVIDVLRLCSDKREK